MALLARKTAVITGGSSGIGLATTRWFIGEGATDGRIGTSVYAATKAALRSFARTWANELAPRNIRVNTVNPAFADTPGLTGPAGGTSAESMQQFKHERSQGIPLRRAARTDKVANAVLFLASDLSSFTTGAALPVDGGHSHPPPRRPIH